MRCIARPRVPGPASSFTGAGSSGRRCRGRGVVVDMCFLAVLFLLVVVLAVVMTMSERIVVMRVRVPVRAVLPGVKRVIGVVVRDVVMIVAVGPRRVRMLRLLTFALRALRPGAGRFNLHRQTLALLPAHYRQAAVLFSSAQSVPRGHVTR